MKRIPKKKFTSAFYGVHTFRQKDEKCGRKKKAEQALRKERIAGSKLGKVTKAPGAAGCKQGSDESFFFKVEI